MLFSMLHTSNDDFQKKKIMIRRNVKIGMLNVITDTEKQKLEEQERIMHLYYGFPQAVMLENSFKNCSTFKRLWTIKRRCKLFCIDRAHLSYFLFLSCASNIIYLKKLQTVWHHYNISSPSIFVVAEPTTLFSSQSSRLKIFLYYVKEMKWKRFSFATNKEKSFSF